jgi:thymidylate synthase ThyX
MTTRCQLNPEFAQRIGNFGFLELEDSWGDESTIINTARISTTNHRLDSLEEFGDKDRNLLYHLLSHNHGNPLKLSIFVCQRLDEVEAREEIKKVSGGRNPYRARARELLCNAMPVSTYSDLYWTINFRSLMNFFALRCKPDAQQEIRQFADAAFTMFQLRFPLLAETMNRVLEERSKGG